MKKPRYKIYRSIKGDYFFICKKIRFLFFSWYMEVFDDDQEDILRFESVKQCKNYIRDVLEWEDEPKKTELVEEIW